MKEIKFCHNIQSLNVQLLFYLSICMYIFIYMQAHAHPRVYVCINFNIKSVQKGV